MPSQVLADLVTAVTNARGAMASATLLINGLGARIQAAIDAALAKGATEAELQPLSDLAAAVNAETSALATAVAANP